MREVNIVKLYVPYITLPGDDHVFWCHSCQMGHTVLSVTLATGSVARYLHYCQLGTYPNGIDVYLWPCVRVSSGSCKTRFLGIVLAAAICQKCNGLVLL